MFKKLKSLCNTRVFVRSKLFNLILYTIYATKIIKVIFVKNFNGEKNIHNVFFVKNF